MNDLARTTEEHSLVAATLRDALRVHPQIRWIRLQAQTRGSGTAVTFLHSIGAEALDGTRLRLFNLTSAGAPIIRSIHNIFGSPAITPEEDTSLSAAWEEINALLTPAFEELQRAIDARFSQTDILWVTADEAGVDIGPRDASLHPAGRVRW